MPRKWMTKIVAVVLGLLMWSPAPAGAVSGDPFNPGGGSGGWRQSRAICADGAVDVPQFWYEGPELWVSGWIDACEGTDIAGATWGFVVFTEKESYEGPQFGYRSSDRYDFSVMLTVQKWGVAKALCQASSPIRRLSCFKIDVVSAYNITFTAIAINDPILNVPYKYDRIPPDPSCLNCV